TNDICDTVNCVKTAAMLAEKMDQSMDPCEDFDKYACGNFYQTVALEDGETRKNSFSLVSDRNNDFLKSILAEETKPGDRDYMINAKNLYKSCMDEGKIEEIGVQPFLNTSYAKEWPTLIGENWAGEASFSLDDFNERYMSVSVDPFFSFAVTSDIMNSSRHTIWLTDPMLCLSRQYLTRARNDSVLQAYEKYLKDYAVALGAAPRTAARDAAAFLDLEMQLANITVPPEERRDYFKMYNPTRLRDLRQNYSYIDIPRGIRAAFTLANMTLEDDQDVTLLFPSYFEKLEAVLATAEKRTLMNLFGFMNALTRVRGLTKQLRKIDLEWAKVYTGTTQELPRWKKCLGYATSTFSLGISKEFTRRKFSEDSKHYMDIMIDHLKDSFRNILHDASWMSDKTKGEAFLKLDAMGRKIGYPDRDFDDEHFSEKYENLTMATDNFYQNSGTIFWTGFIKHLRKLSKPVDKNAWGLEPYEVNAYYSPPENEVVFPAGILQPPFFSDIFPDSINYGAIGMVIGHEITHGFDDQGSQYDKKGVLRNWWQQEDKAKFKDKRQCLVDQYGAFRVDAVGMNVNGINTQGENVADNGGLKESWRAYKKLVKEKGEEKRLPGLGLTHDQVFFLGYAQIWCDKMTKQRAILSLSNGVHSPGRFRTIGVLQNSPDFAQAFRCPAGSPMNPEKKCSVW
ncbi:hypothetical protein RRG08_017916, partial [Elysia crispata]